MPSPSLLQLLRQRDGRTCISIFNMTSFFMVTYATRSYYAPIVMLIVCPDRCGFRYGYQVLRTMFRAGANLLCNSELMRSLGFLNGFTAMEGVTLDMFPEKVERRLRAQGLGMCMVCYTECVGDLAVLIPCGHLFCWECLEGMVGVEGLGDVCPCCRVRLRWVTGWKGVCACSGVGVVEKGKSEGEEKEGDENYVYQVERGVMSVVTKREWEKIRKTLADEKEGGGSDQMRRIVETEEDVAIEEEYQGYAEEEEEEEMDFRPQWP